MPAPALNVLSVLGQPALFLLTQSDWINRRKESVEILDDDWVRRRTVLDFTLPAETVPLADVRPLSPLEHVALIAAGGGRIPADVPQPPPARFVVPLTLLPKLPPTLMRFDLEDDAGKTLLLPTRRQCHLAAYAALQWAALRYLAPRGDLVKLHLAEELRGELLHVATAEPEVAARAAASIAEGHPPPEAASEVAIAQADNELLAWSTQLSRSTYDLARPASSRAALVDRGELERQDQFTWLVDLLAANTLVMVDFEARTQERRRIRLRYEQKIVKARPEPRTEVMLQQLGWRPLSLVLEMPYARSGTYHIEAGAPDGMEFVESELFVRRDPQPAAQTAPRDEREPTRGVQIHRYLRDALEVDEVELHLALRAQREGFIGSAFAAALSVAVVLTALTVFATDVLRTAIGVQAFLFVFPSLFVTLAARAAKPLVLSRALRLARRVLILAAVLAYAAAMAMLITPTGPTSTASTELRIWWGLLAALAVLATGALALSRVLPRAEPGRLERVVAVLEKLGERVELRGLRLEIRSTSLLVPPGSRLADDPDLPLRLRRRWAGRAAWARGYYGPALVVQPRTKGRSILTSAPARSVPDGGPGKLYLTEDGREALSEVLRRLAVDLAGRFELIVSWRGSTPGAAPVTMSSGQMAELVAADRLAPDTRYEVRD